MPSDLTPEQREAALNRMAEAMNGPGWDGTAWVNEAAIALEAFLAGWTPPAQPDAIAAAEARGYARGVEAAKGVAHGYLDKLHPPAGWSDEEVTAWGNGCCDMVQAVEQAIAALSPIPQEADPT